MGLPRIRSRWYKPLYTPCRESTELTNEQNKETMGLVVSILLTKRTIWQAGFREVITSLKITKIYIVALDKAYCSDQSSGGGKNCQFWQKTMG